VRALLLDCREMFVEQITYRELLFQMTWRDLLLRYTQTIMGFGWAIFMPLVNTIVFYVIFQRVAHVETPGLPYLVFAYCGLWAWNFLASALRFSVVSLTSNSNLVAKIYFPREIFPFSAVLVCLVDFAVGGILLVALMLWYQVPVGVNLLWFPVVLLVHITFTATIALLLSMANLFYRDVKYIFEVAITIWMFASPVVYPVQNVSGRLGTLFKLNPVTPILDAFRNVLVLNQPPGMAFAAIAGLSVVLFAVSWTVFHRLEFQFAERI
jgi:ABC-type polysaccharide/polyol phosphate export permease